jgi:hypothetical protein
MDREAWFDSGDWGVFPGHYLDSVDIRGLSPLDEVVIRTANSTYFFLVTDPKERHGILTGGKLGSSARQALVIESLGMTKRGEVEGDSDLRIGSRALFFVLSLAQPQLLTTSGIQRLGVIRSEGQTVTRSETETMLH